MHNEKKQKEDTGKKSDAHDHELQIDSPDSIHEKEADAIAMKVVHGDQLMGGGNGIQKDQVMGNGKSSDGMISRKGAKMGEQGMVASNNVREGINATKGGGDLLSGNVKQQMKGVLGGELDDVRIHTDSNAAEMSKAVNANAFTIGKDIYFGQGKFDMYTSEGKQLLAHELAHTKQQSGMIQREPQSTFWGEFEDTYFETTHSNKLSYGADMDLKFKPGDFVNATKIGMLQISKAYEVDDTGKKAVFLDDTERKQSIQKIDSKENKQLNEQEEGFQIDQDPQRVNPLYAVDRAKSGQALKDARIKRSGGGPGWNYIDDKKGKPHKRNAGLYDSPEWTLEPGVTEMGMVFESTALAVEGKQEGTYYGSVSWGWKWNAAEGVKKIDLKKISDGAVSTTFLKAASMWNKSVSSEGEKTINLPVPVFYETTEAVDFYVGETFSASNAMSMPAPLRVQKLTFTPVKEKPELILVKIIDGHSPGGISGWIDQRKLKEEDISVHSYEETK